MPSAVEEGTLNDWTTTEVPHQFLSAFVKGTPGFPCRWTKWASLPVARESPEANIAAADAIAKGVCLDSLMLHVVFFPLSCHRSFWVVAHHDNFFKKRLPKGGSVV